MSTSRREHLEAELHHAVRLQTMLTVMFIQAVAARVSANPTDLQCLNLLTLQGPMTPSRLAEAMAITKGGAITAMVDRLEKAGYVRRTRDPRDRRQVLVDTVDDAPLRQLVARFSPIGERLTGLLAHYTDEELEVILDFAARSNDAVRRHL